MNTQRTVGTHHSRRNCARIRLQPDLPGHRLYLRNAGPTLKPSARPSRGMTQSLVDMSPPLSAGFPGGPGRKRRRAHGGHNQERGSAAVAGMVNQKVLPCPSLLSIQMRPPCASTTILQNVSPSPVLILRPPWRLST